MSTGVVADASAIVALLVDSGSDGAWASQHFAGARIVAPALMPFEAANIFRRLEHSRSISADQAAQAHRDLGDMPAEYWPYEAVAERAWELRHNATIYDAGYIALAELLRDPLVTLDRRIASVPRLRCAVLTP